MGHKEVTQIPVHKTPGYELQDCVGMSYTDDGCYLVAIYLQRSKFSPNAGEAHTLLINSYDANANYAHLSTLHLPLLSETPLAGLHAIPLFHRGDLHYHTLQMLITTPSHTLTYPCTFLYGDLQSDYRSRFRTLSRDSGILEAWTLPGSRFVMVDEVGCVNVFSMEGDNVYLDAKAEGSGSLLREAAIARVKDGTFAIGMVHDGNNGEATVVKLMLGATTAVSTQVYQIKVGQ